MGILNPWENLTKRTSVSALAFETIVYRNYSRTHYKKKKKRKEKKNPSLVSGDFSIRLNSLEHQKSPFIFLEMHSVLMMKWWR